MISPIQGTFFQPLAEGVGPVKAQPAKVFEELLVRQFLQEARLGTVGPGVAGSLASDVMVQVVTGAVVESGGLGLGAHLEPLNRPSP